MKKSLKLALDPKQISIKNQFENIDGFEIHLFGDERDNFDLLPTIQKPIFTVHYPLDRCDVLQCACEFETEYAQKVFAFCLKNSAGLVLHAESFAFDIYNNPQIIAFCQFIKDKGLRVHVENCYRNIGAVEALQITHYLQHLVNDKQIIPLLDTCHLMMSEMSFKYEEFSFFQTIEAYKSDHFTLHLNDCIGSGEIETGGVHGTNFENNLYLLNNILWKLYNLEKHNYDVKVVLEIEEEDYYHVPKAIALANNIDHFYQLYLEQENI